MAYRIFFVQSNAFLQAVDRLVIGGFPSEQYAQTDVGIFMLSIEFNYIAVLELGPFVVAPQDMIEGHIVARRRRAYRYVPGSGHR